MYAVFQSRMWGMVWGKVWGKSNAPSETEMPRQNRVSTKYPGVFFVDGTHHSGKPERIYYIRYRRDGKLVEERAGRQFQDKMTEAKASKLRALRIDGDQKNNREQREEAQAALEAERGRWTIDRLWEEYKVQRPDLKGIISDDNRFKVHLKKTFGKKVPAEIITLDVDRLRLSLLKKRKPQTVKNVLELLRRIINFGVKKGLCPDIDRAKLNIEFPRVDNERTEDLNPTQLSALIQSMDEDPNQQVAAMMKMALFTGMRRGELFKLQWGHIDFERGFIGIVDPKGKVSQKIPLNNAARVLLEEHEHTGSEYVFPGRGGGQRKDCKAPANRIKNRAGLPADFRPFHGLRHVYASMLASSGEVDMYTLQKLLTHKSAAMTQRYAHLRDDALHKASAVAGDMFMGLGKAGQDKVVNLDDHRK